MATKIEKGQIKSLLRTILQEQGVEPKIGPSKGYLWKEQIMQMVQSEMKSVMQSGSIKSQADFQAELTNILTKVRADFDLTFSMVERTLKQVPFQAFAESTKPKTSSSDR